jgi:hypothetical protein
VSSEAVHAFQKAFAEDVAEAYNRRTVGGTWFAAAWVEVAYL